MLMLNIMPVNIPMEKSDGGIGVEKFVLILSERIYITVVTVASFLL